MIAGYCWPQSGLPREQIELFCESEASRCAVDISRIGQTSVSVLETTLDISSTSTEPSLTIEIQTTWPTGFYLVTLNLENGARGHAFFVVRSSEPKPALLVLSTSTWAAYNDWRAPSFYTGGQTSSLRRPLPVGMLQQTDPHKYRIARYINRTKEEFKEMQALGYGPWCHAAGWANWESLFVQWVEREGFEIAYATSQDLDQNPDLLEGYRAYLSVGHDEYWSENMRNHVEDFVDAGGNAAFFSGNTAFWQIRFEDDGERIVSYKTNFTEDPLFKADSSAKHIPNLATMWSDPLVGRPENQMTGVSFNRGGYAHMPNSPLGTGGYEIWQPEHWAFAGLKLNQRDQLGASELVVGYECDGCEFEMNNGQPRVTGKDDTPTNFQILGTAPAQLWETHEVPGVLHDEFVGELNWAAARLAGEDNQQNRQKFAQGHAVMGYFSKGNGQVFTTGCTDWAYGLGSADVSTVTRNVLSRFTGR